MTPQQIEAMKLALEALEYALNKPMWNRPKMTVAITALEEALAQPEQEPVAWLDPWTHSNATTDYDAYGKHGIPLYTTPPQPERHELQAKGEHPAPCARHCEANAFQIVIKNLKAQLAQPEQEPVAIERMKEWIEYLKYLKRTSDQHMKIPSEMSAGTCWELALELEQFINTTPPQRTWVGLTDEDMYVVSEEESCSFIAGAKWSEEILKEKNAICSPFMISELWRLNK